MNPSPSLHRDRLPLGMVALLLAVFLWGFHYKLSLYHQADQSRPSLPPAKLLVDAENPSSSQAVLSSHLRSRLKVANAAAVLSAFQASPLGGLHDALLDVRQVPAPSARVSRQFLPRPPPAA